MSMHNIPDKLKRGLFTATMEAFSGPAGWSFGHGTTVGNGVEGWAPGALFVHTDGAKGSFVYVNEGSVTSASWVALSSGVTAQAFLGIPLAGFRQAASDDIPDMTDTPATDDQYGGLLHKGSQPILEATNGDTDGALRLNFANNTSYAITAQVPLPPDVNLAADLVLHLRAAMAGATDTPVVNMDSYFNEGDTKVSDAVAAITGTAFAEYLGTIAAADIPAGAQTLTMELTPAAHTTDSLYVTAAWLEYTRLALTA